MGKEFAPGIKRNHYPGDLTKLKPGDLLDYVIQKHDALRAGPHYDFRIGDKKRGLYSWAMRSQLPTDSADKHLAAQTNLHTHKYKDWEGYIPKGFYGAGKVKKFDEGKILLTANEPDHLSFTITHKKHPQRYTLVHPDQFGIRDWLMTKRNTPDETGSEKKKYKSVKEEDLDKVIEKLQVGWTAQPKLDGALNFLNLKNNKAEMLSHRISKTTKKPVVQTERFFGTLPKIQLPKELRNAVLLSEVYGMKGDKTIPIQELGGLLNSTVHKSLTDQKDRDIQLKAMLFDIAKKNGKPVELPYTERRALLQEYIKHLPKGKFHLPEEVHTPEEVKKLVEDIKAGKHPHTSEGIVIHPSEGKPIKMKIFPERDVWIKDFFEGEGKYKGKGVGGFTYSTSPQGPIVGRVGTGLSDDTRKLFYEDPDAFKGRMVRVHSQGAMPSGALRVPVMKALHEDY